MSEREAIARAINPGAWNLTDRMPALVAKDPFHRSKIDMSLAAADRVVLALTVGGALAATPPATRTGESI